MKKKFTVLFIILWVFLAIANPIVLLLDFIQDALKIQIVSPPLYYVILGIMAVLYILFAIGAIIACKKGKM